MAVQLSEQFRLLVAEEFKDRSVCHALSHAKSVAHLANEIYMACVAPEARSTADVVKLEAICLLHDAWDYKFVSKPTFSMRTWHHRLQQTGFSSEDADEIIQEINLISFSKGETPVTLVGQIAQDADRLTATGIEGILRFITYGSFSNMEFESSLNNLMMRIMTPGRPYNTETARRLAVVRDHRVAALVRVYQEETSMKLLPDNLGYISEQEDFIVKVIVQNSRILSAMLFRRKSGIPSHAVNFDKEGLDITFLGWSVKKLLQEVEIIENASKAQGDMK